MWKRIINKFSSSFKFAIENLLIILEKKKKKKNHNFLIRISIKHRAIRENIVMATLLLIRMVTLLLCYCLKH